MRRRALASFLFLLLSILCPAVHADIYSQVRGVVHDAQHPSPSPAPT